MASRALQESPKVKTKCSKVGSIVFSLPWSRLPRARAYVCETLTESPLKLRRLYPTQLDTQCFSWMDHLPYRYVGAGVPAGPAVPRGNVGYGAAQRPPPTVLYNTDHPSGGEGNEQAEGPDIISGSGAKGTTGRLEEAAGQ